jgi:hypothetical protein
MSTRRSRPPRNRKSRKPEASPNDLVVSVPSQSPVEELVREPSSVLSSDDLAALDAGWD